MAETAAAAKDNTGSGTETTEQKPAGETKTGETKPAATTDETKPGAESAEKPAGKDDAATQSKAPEKYTLTLPDGGRIDDRDLATIETVARANGWSNEEAQTRVNMHADAIEAQSNRFVEETKTDAVYGGAHFENTLKHAGIALDKLRPKGTPRGDAFRALLDKSGYGNHLEVVSLLADLGKLMVEDGTAGGGGEESAPQDLASRLYPTMK